MGAVSANADITSENVVGYTSKELTAGKFTIAGSQFENIASQNVEVQDITGLVGSNYDEDSAFVATAPKILLYSDAGYTTYYYLNDGYDLELDDGTTAAGWCDSSGNLVNVQLAPGTAFWMKSNADGTANSAGSVPTAESTDVDCPIGFALRANAYPVSFKLNSSQLTSTDIVGANYDEDSAFVATAPKILLYSDSGYTTYYYLNDGYDLILDDGTTAAGWCDSSGNLVTDATIAPMEGFWIKGVTGAFTLTFAK